MRRKKNKQMEGQMSIFDMFSSVIENTKTEEENVTVSEGGIAAADITAVETGTQTSIFDLFSTDEQDTQKQEKKPKKNFFHRTIQFAKSLEDKWKNNLAALKMLLGLDDYADEEVQHECDMYEEKQDSNELTYQSYVGAKNWLSKWEKLYIKYNDK